MMNIDIAELFDNFCKKSLNYNLPGIIQANIHCLEYMVQEWYNLEKKYQSNQIPIFLLEDFELYKKNLHINTHKTIINLVEKISNYNISSDLTRYFNEIVEKYMDFIMQNKHQTNELINMFNKMTISSSPNELVELMSKISI